MKYVPGLLAGQLSGKAGNTVASRNRSGSYFRTRTIPKRVRNALTTAVRNDFTVNSQGYRNLEEAQRNAWTALGSGIVRKNSLGVAFHLTGLQAFQSVNRNLTALGQASVADAPAFDAADGLVTMTPTVAAGVSHSTTITAGADSATQTLTAATGIYVGAVIHNTTQGWYATVTDISGSPAVVLDRVVHTATADAIVFLGIPTFDLAFTPTPVPANTNAIIYVTAPLSAGIARPSKSAYRQLTTMDPGDTSPQSIGALYGARFGSPQAGQKVFVRVKFISLNGIGGQEIINGAIVS